ncbi:MAG: carbohydrate-binding protein, partial [Oscillospiraceae bacterium]|nr:carbohydrate-binding protein [Oscillospiraceae bacterium]
MKLRKVTGFIIVTVIIMYMISVTVTASTGFELGEFTVISENNQQNGWCTNGVNGIETKLYIRAFQRVTDLFFEFDTEVGNITLVCLGDGNGWTWTETPVQVNGTWFDINVKDINGWAETIAGNDLEIILCNYNPSWEGITVKGFTSMPGGPFENEEAWTPKNFKIGSGKTIITAVDFDSDSYEEHGAEYARYIVRPEMEEKKGPQTEVGSSGFGDDICCIDAGEWVQYTVDVTAAGTYNFAAWLASDSGKSGNIEVYIDDMFVGISADS